MINHKEVKYSKNFQKDMKGIKSLIHNNFKVSKLISDPCMIFAHFFFIPSNVYV